MTWARGMKQTTTEEIRRGQVEEKMSQEERQRQSRHVLAMMREMEGRRERWRKKNGWGSQ